MSAPSPPAPSLPLRGVLTYHNDNARLGARDDETILTTANVAPETFGRLMAWPVTGDIYGQPLIVEGLSIGGALRRVLYVATSQDAVYAFDADTGGRLWTTSFLGSGITPWVAGTDFSCADMLSPTIGVLSTPVIALGDGTATLYVIAATNDHGTLTWTLHKLNGSTGAILASQVVSASVSGTGSGSSGGTLAFDPALHIQRPGLLLSNGVVYAAFGSLCDAGNYHGWVMGWDASTLSQTMAWATTPNGGEAGIWNPGGLVADADGKLYVTTGNGDFDVDVPGTDYGMSAVKLDTDGSVLDWFTTSNWSALSALDKDIASGGLLLTPHGHLVFGTKGNGPTDNETGDGVVFVLDPSDLGHIVTDNPQIVQSWSNGNPVFTPPAWFNDRLVLADKEGVRSYAWTGSAFNTTPTSFAGGFSRGVPWISSNGSSEGIVWIADNGGFHTAAAPAVLYALKASDLSLLWSSDQADGHRDIGPGRVKWASPMVYGGRVYLGGNGAVVVYGLTR